jgi:flagellar biosynthesis chaperone FliJ
MNLNKNIEPSTQTYQKQRKKLEKDRKEKIIGYIRLQAFCPLSPQTVETMLEEEDKYKSK